MKYFCSLVGCTLALTLGTQALGGQFKKRPHIQDAQPDQKTTPTLPIQFQCQTQFASAFGPNYVIEIAFDKKDMESSNLGNHGVIYGVKATARMGLLVDGQDVKYSDPTFQRIKLNVITRSLPSDAEDAGYKYQGILNGNVFAISENRESNDSSDDSRPMHGFWSQLLDGPSSYCNFCYLDSLSENTDDTHDIHSHYTSKLVCKHVGE